MDDIMLTSFSSAGGGALATYLGGGKVEILIPMIAGLLGTMARILRNQLSFYMTIGQIKDPILLDQTVVVKNPVLDTTHEPEKSINNG